MAQGFRSALRLAATVATAAAVVATAATVRRLLSQPSPAPPRHRALRPAAPALAPAIVLTADFGKTKPQPTFHPFGPEPCVVPSHGIEIRPPTPAADVIELEASGELDGDSSPTERLLARRHALDGPTPGSARDAPEPARRYG